MNFLLVYDFLTFPISFHSPSIISAPNREKALTCPRIFCWGVVMRLCLPGEVGPGALYTVGVYTPDRVDCPQWRSAWLHQSPDVHQEYRSGCRIPPHPHPGVWWSVGYHRKHFEDLKRCSFHWLSIVWHHWQLHWSPSQWRQRSPRWSENQGPRGTGIPARGSSLVAQDKLEGLCVG